MIVSRHHHSHWPLLPYRICVTLLIVSMPLIISSCRRRPVPSQAFQEIASSLGTPREEVETVRIYIDASASMRGFALAATKNETGVSAPFQSLLSGLDSLAEEVASPNVEAEKPAKATKKPTPEKTGPARKEIYRFGALIEPLAPSIALVSAPLGRAPVPPIGGLQVNPAWLSKDCGQKWGGSPAARLAVDSFFSETLTCLNPVFDETAANGTEKKAFVIVTDAEQLAPEGSEKCPSAKSLGTVQARIDEWIRVKHRYAAVAAFRLGYLPWEAPASGKRYCACNEQLLFVYILTPGPEMAEKIYGILAHAWKGDPDAISYLPLAPRPASQFDIEVSLPYEGDKKPALFPTNYPKSLQEPQISRLPVFPVELKGEKATVLVSVKKAGFERPEARVSPGFSKLNWSKAAYSWKEVSTRFSLQKSGKKPVSFVQLSGPSEVEVLLHGEAPTEPEKATRRSGRFQGRATVLSESETTIELPQAAFLLKRTPAKHGSEAFLIELTADSSPLVADFWKDHPLIGKASGSCIRLESLREQVLLAGRTSPVVRFILHVDY